MPTTAIEEAINKRRLYFVGDRLPPNWFEAFRYWMPMAEAGDPKAQFNIGRCYSLGDGVDKNIAQAIAWFNKATEQGDPRAHFNLFIEEKDVAKKERHLEKAAELGESRALFELGSRALKANQKEIAYAHFKRAHDVGLEVAWQGIAAAQIEFVWEVTTEQKFYDYVAGPMIINGTTVSSGGSRTGTYDSPIILISVTNNSQWTIQPGFNVAIQDPATGKEVNMSGVQFKSSIGPGETGKGSYYFKEERQYRHVAVQMTVTQSDDLTPFDITPVILREGVASKCFVVTACMDDENHPVVWSYRRFRDEKLINFRVGRAFISAYYKVGPKMAVAIAGQPRLKQATRWTLERFARML